MGPLSTPAPGLHAVDDLARQVQDLAISLREEAAAASTGSAGAEWRSPAADRMRQRVADRDVEARRLAIELDELADRLRAHSREAAERAAEIARALAAGQDLLGPGLSAAAPGQEVQP